ncbi:LysR family transcriptional regulator [Metabacillus sp. GX 13764]|uniref:LysR family transcriptional regulator n=1 Tax=Metabacillus kandeliae TaxID=2900151 RepID=UPI001E483777|nr:LysR family transcriptional regulator [Metabacillus kandeliae]MCD7035797.1 LysR family transcriptional regulator [Metabacillus kandeliae]
MIDFEWYRSFISIYKHRSVSAAAKARYMTQPAMSQHLAALEAEAGEPLFARAPRKMIPTEKGKELYAKLVPLIEELEAASLALKIRQEEAVPLVRLASAPEYFTGRAIDRIRKSSYRYHTLLGPADALLQWLMEEKAELIITPKRMEEPGIEYLFIEQEEFVIAAPPYMSQLKTEEDAENFLIQQKWLSYGQELPIIRRFWRQHFQKRPQIQPLYVVPDLRAILMMIEKGMGISILPAYLLKEALLQKKVVLLYPAMRVKNDIYLAYKIKNKENPVLQEVIKLFE